MCDHSLEKLRNAQVAKNLSNIEYLQVQNELYRAQSRKIQFSCAKRCAVCRNPLTCEQFLWLPDDSVAHIACGKTLQVMSP